MNSIVLSGVFQKPLELFRRRRYDEALKLLQEVDNTQLNCERIQYLLARCYFRAGQFSLAIQCYKQALPQNKNDFRFWYRYGQCQIACGDFEGARVAFEHAKDLNTDSEISTYLLAISAHRVKFFDQSIKCLKEVSHFVDSFGYSFGIVTLLLREGKGTTIEDLPKVNDWPEYVVMLGIERARLSNDIETVKALSKLLWDADPSIWGGSWIRASLKPFTTFLPSSVYMKDKLKDYFLCLERSENLFAANTVIYLETIGRLSLFVGLKELSSEIFDKRLALDRSDVDVLYLAGTCYYLNGLYEQAIDCFSEILAINPDDKRANFKLAISYEACGELDHACQCVAHHLNNVPRDIMALLWLAKYYLSNNDIAMAEKQLVKVGRISPRHPRLIEVREEFRELAGRLVNPASTMPDYSYINWKKIQIPQEFMYRNNDTSSESIINEISGVFATLSNVISALMVREMTTRFGKNGLGYLWVVIQQVIFVGIFAIVFKVQGRQLSYGVEHIAFLITGINSFFVFTNTKGQIKSALTAGKSLLYYRQISPVAIYLARGILEIFTGVFIFAVLVSVSVMFGENLHMSSLLEVLFILFMLALFGGCLGLFISSVSVFFPAIDHFDAAITRGLFFTSGLFFYANELPEKVRDLLMWNPIFHLIELLRGGFFYSYDAKFASMGYVAGWTIGFLFLALILERIARSRMLQI